MYESHMFPSQEDQSVPYYNQACISDEKEKEKENECMGDDTIGFTLVESALSELRSLVSHASDSVKILPTQIHPNIHQSTGERRLKEYNEDNGFHPVQSHIKVSKFMDSVTHTKKQAAGSHSNIVQHTSKRFMKSKMEREEEIVDDYRDDFEQLFPHGDYELDSDTSMAIESSKMMFARTRKHSRCERENSTISLATVSDIDDKPSSTTCFNPMATTIQTPEKHTKRRSKSSSIQKVDFDTISQPSFVTLSVKRIATPWDDCDNEDEDAPSSENSKESTLEERLVSSSGKEPFNFVLPSPEVPLKSTPAVLHVGDDESAHHRKVRFDNKVDVRQFSDGKCRDFTRVIEGRKRDKRLKKKHTWGAAGKTSKEESIERPSILKRTGWVPGENITDRKIPLFSPDSEHGRIALHFGIDPDDDENVSGSSGCDDDDDDAETDQVSQKAFSPTLIGCDMWDEEEEWRPNSKSFADTPLKRFKVKLQRFIYGFKLHSEKLHYLVIRTQSDSVSGSANQLFVSPDLSETESFEEIEPCVTVVPMFGPMTMSRPRHAVDDNKFETILQFLSLVEELCHEEEGTEDVVNETAPVAEETAEVRETVEEEGKMEDRESVTNSVPTDEALRERVFYRQPCDNNNNCGVFTQGAEFFIAHVDPRMNSGVTTDPSDISDLALSRRRVKLDHQIQKRTFKDGKISDVFGRIVRGYGKIDKEETQKQPRFRFASVKKVLVKLKLKKPTK
ncbi:hypothetical protein CANMA_005063, partial [Candida margitis]|uniref:uncharacterized protein n=1 Tax=Candida margitis TaxID=1775924 RepID=UPI0022269A44